MFLLLLEEEEYFFEIIKVKLKINKIDFLEMKIRIVALLDWIFPKNKNERTLILIKLNLLLWKHKV